MASDKSNDNIMGQISKPLIAEEVLEEVLSYLPEMSFDKNGEKYPVRFGYGDLLELNNFLANREISDVYPLVWMLYSQREEHLKTRVNLPSATFILAVTTNSSMENAERVKLTYGKVLMPLFHNIRLAFRQSNVITIASEHEKIVAVKHPNFSESIVRSKSGVTAIWDALKITVDLSIIEGCIKPIKFFK